MRDCNIRGERCISILLTVVIGACTLCGCMSPPVKRYHITTEVNGVVRSQSDVEIQGKNRVERVVEYIYLDEQSKNKQSLKYPCVISPADQRQMEYSDDTIFF